MKWPKVNQLIRARKLTQTLLTLKSVLNHLLVSCFSGVKEDLSCSISICVLYHSRVSSHSTNTTDPYNPFYL